MFFGVLLFLRFLRVWLLKAWLEEVGQNYAQSELERARVETVQEICSNMEQNRRAALLRRGITSTNSSVADYPPPKYEDVVGSTASSTRAPTALTLPSESQSGTTSGSNDVKIDIDPEIASCEEDKPPDYESLFFEDALARSKLDRSK